MIFSLHKRANVFGFLSSLPLRPPPPPRQSFAPTCHLLLLTSTVLPVRACLSIRLERFHGSQKEDERIKKIGNRSQNKSHSCVPLKQVNISGPWLVAVQLRAVQVYLSVLQGHRGPRRGGDLPVQVHIYNIIFFISNVIFIVVILVDISRGMRCYLNLYYYYYPYPYPRVSSERWVNPKTNFAILSIGWGFNVTGVNLQYCKIQKFATAETKKTQVHLTSDIRHLLCMKQATTTDSCNQKQQSTLDNRHPITNNYHHAWGTFYNQKQYTTNNSWQHTAAKNLSIFSEIISKHSISHSKSTVEQR